MNLLDHNLAKKFLIGLFLLPIFSIPAHAETDEKDTWRFQVAPYAWLAGQKGTVATLPGLPPADIDVNFYDDVLGNINGALFLVGASAPEFINSGRDQRPVSIGVHIRPCGTNNLAVCRHLPGTKAAKQPWQNLAPGQISCTAKNDKIEWFNRDDTRDHFSDSFEFETSKCLRYH